MDDHKPVDRRKLFRLALAGIATVMVAALPVEASARPKWGNPPGWSRGRKRGWGKKGGPKWR